MNEETSIEKLIDLIAKILGKEVEIEKDIKRIRPKKSEVEELICNNTKIKKFTNWKPAYNLQTGLKETIEWFEDNKHRYKPEIYNV
jgi:dTDP-glucose 4,6-dehydratase